MNVGAALQGGVLRVLRTARAVLGAAEDSSSRADDAGEAPIPADFSFRCGFLLSVRLLQPPLTASRACSEDCDEERDVAQAWSVYSSALASAVDRRAALDAFLAVFVLRCSAWSPAEPGTLERAAPARLRGCSTGHPLALLRALAEAVEQAAIELEHGAPESQRPHRLIAARGMSRSRVHTVAQSANKEARCWYSMQSTCACSRRFASWCAHATTENS